MPALLPRQGRRRHRRSARRKHPRRRVRECRLTRTRLAIRRRPRLEDADPPTRAITRFFIPLLVALIAQGCFRDEGGTRRQPALHDAGDPCAIDASDYFRCNHPYPCPVIAEAFDAPGCAPGAIDLATCNDHYGRIITLAQFFSVNPNNPPDGDFACVATEIRYWRCAMSNYPGRITCSQDSRSPVVPPECDPEVAEAIRCCGEFPATCLPVGRPSWLVR